MKSFELRSIWSRPQTPSNSGKSEHDVWKNLKKKNIARIANGVTVTVNVEIVVLNCQKCNQCLKGHKSLGLFFEGVLHFSLSFSFLLFCHCLFVGKVMSPHHSDQKSQGSQVSRGPL